MKVGDKFKVEIEDKGRFVAEIINIDNDPANSDRQYELVITQMHRKDSRGKSIDILKHIVIERGQCKHCKHWKKYSDGTMRCAFYASIPRITDGDMWCDIDNIKKFGYEVATVKD